MIPHTPLAVGITLGAYWLFSSAAGAMLPPAPGQERTRYGFFFRLVQNLAANGHRLEQRFPGLAAELAAAEELGAGGRTSVTVTETIHHTS